MPPALLFRFSWDLSYHEPVSSASPWCFPVNACVLCHTHSIPYMLIYMSVPLLEIREQSRWISRKQIYFSIVYESFLLNFDLHVFDYNWDWTFFRICYLPIAFFSVFILLQNLSSIFYLYAHLFSSCWFPRFLMIKAIHAFYMFCEFLSGFHLPLNFHLLFGSS